ncbi:MAG: RDD family protein [Arcobacteraceae bacterium]|nr:RDD family protein [Arcobacteraceae bacterium]
MSRWRDIKKGKIEQNPKKDKKIQKEPSFCDSTLTNRMKAFITDSFMVMMPLMYLVSYIVIGSLEEFSQNKLMGWLYILIPHFAITVSFWYFKAQTPGLKAYELSIVNSTTGGKPSVFALINRYIFTTISMMLILPLFVPYLNKEKKTLQDIVSSTCIKNTSNETL